MGMFRSEWQGIFDRHEELRLYGRCQVMVRILVEASARIDPCRPGLSALEWACQVAMSGNYSILHLLLELRIHHHDIRANVERVYRVYSLVTDGLGDNEISKRTKISKRLLLCLS
jgi:hypothetical protein